jgi:CTP:molybdopterin cytidylyltransferase MocA
MTKRAKHAAITAIVLAAGFSSRMGALKPLLDIGGKPALIRLLDSIAEAGIGRVCVVTGHGRAAIEAALRESFGDMRGASPEILHNADFEEGMFRSVQTGISYARQGGFAGALLFPADVPLVSPKTILAVCAAAGPEARPASAATACARPASASPSVAEPPAADTPASPPAAPPAAPVHFVLPRYRGANGHPLFVPAANFEAILRHAGEGGLKAVRDRHALLRVETDDEGCVLDMDTPEDYVRMQALWHVAFGQLARERGLLGPR